MGVSPWSRADSTGLPGLVRNRACLPGPMQKGTCLPSPMWMGPVATAGVQEDHAPQLQTTDILLCITELEAVLEKKMQSQLLKILSHEELR